MIYRLQSIDLIDKRVKDGVGERLDIERFNMKKKDRGFTGRDR